MEKKIKVMFIILIVLSFILSIIPFGGVVTGILAIILFKYFKKNEMLNLSNSDLEKEVKKREEELKNIRDEKVSELNKIEDFKNQYEYLNDIVNLEEGKGKLQIRIAALNDELKEVAGKLSISKEILSYQELEKELYTFQVGIFAKQYDYRLSEEYNEQLKINRSNQKEFIKSGNAIINSGLNTLLDSNLKNSEKNKLENSICKLVLRAFNDECDTILSKLTIANIANSRKRLDTAREQINKLIIVYNLSINLDYYKLKVDELQLQYEYLVKVQEEREEQREIKERIKEENRVQAEIMRLEKEAEKEEIIYQKALEKVRLELKDANEEEKNNLELKIKSLEESLKKAEEKMQRAESMAQKTKSGYVYVISNVGSFGEDIYKIGLTRRLDPMERIKELSDASVPFKFDVHAMIYSEDAPALEKELHNHFSENRVNKVNLRKEFFNVKLADIEKAVNDKMNGKIEFTKLAEALEYKQSKLM
ncbi:DUF4041 domain-containing protein [Clostridium sp.]|uniref:DUF4041 domain-containing protein n=1 Tax=Clostridium sp. TaxID=1506 RepID=UPI002639331D|nr:DUF4041 domain-containing protein [Clostridium sp.]